jgi:hypothetical protein
MVGNLIFQEGSMPANFFSRMFCCSSEEWKKVPQKEKDKLGLKVDDDGEFWSVHCTCIQ